MKKTFNLPGFLLIFFLSACNSTQAPNQSDKLADPVSAGAVQNQAPFSKGVNFSGWFEVTKADRIPFTQYTEQDFIDVKSLGADVIRLPVRFNDMTSGDPDYILDPLLFRLLDFAVSWAEKYQIYLIIDNHSFHPVNATPDDVDKVLIPVWSQIAQRYSGRSEYIVYEILNEPHGISDKLWGDIQGKAIESIRKFDKNRWIIIGGSEYNSYNKLSAVPFYNDTKLIYTFHFYDPFLFTHQGASWSPPLEYLSGVPFPPDRGRMPRLPSRLRGTWVEGSLNSYIREGDPAKMLQTLDKIVAFSKEKNVPVFCGEYGVFMKESPPEDRIVWYDFVTKALDNRNIPRASWDYYGGFGIFNKEGKNSFKFDVNEGIVHAMGFNAPQQNRRVIQPRETGFVIFDDYTPQEIYAGFWGDEDADFSFFETNTAQGSFSIRWSNAGRYNAFWFAFPDNGDFNFLAANGCQLEFYARSEQPVRFDVRFLNPENASSIPWRSSYTIDEKSLPPDGKWHRIRIPLAEMREQGAWVSADQSWLNPRGGFSWANIERLEFAAEHMDLKGCRIFFDSVRIIRP
ncbi:MAG: glycoside hydrolase family 5 protein [Treponema sp.]|nr:glycoside hydrolase family 5 protein [Treponema sp.]MCL2271372.1 glycoside hydrolase family 5 protein [Treponema sp.]